MDWRMEIFRKAAIVRLHSHNGKYLTADEDQESVHQNRRGTAKNTRWTVEIVPGSNVIRLQSCYGKYLTASNNHFLLGATGKKVLLPRGGFLVSPAINYLKCN
ncbi:BnaC05g48720D [Brassica napus]|uniref:BnaC05g48720D protein n=1 Tax=Brassica napus TaxID=3708 RepID=A0A078II51_BRANA|nr:BnaC05g48720D [Brassica napus]